MNNYTYVVTPFLAWLVAGGLKFLVNSIKARKPAFGLIGYGGFPSNHSAIVASMAAAIGAREGATHPAFGVALTVAFIVMLDALSLRRQVGKQAALVNTLAGSPILRERMGHTPLEIFGGIVVGAAVGILVAWAPALHFDRLF